MKIESVKPLRAALFCVTPPDEKQKAGIYDFLKRKYGSETELEIVEDLSLSGGFRLQVGSEVFDWSAAGRISQLKEKMSGLDMSGNIIPLLKETISQMQLQTREQEIGTVVSAGESIATIEGLDSAAYGEIVIFESGIKGMVQELRRNEVGCILFGDNEEVSEGDRVIRTGKTAGISVGEAFLGRVIDALGAPIDGGDDIPAADYFPIETRAPGIIDRQPVNEPLQTGILAIDTMFPIGRGQRELIIGDRQTGKTAVALDTILNQKGKDVVCIYVAIGQKASSVAQTVEALRKRDAMDYCIVVNASASDPAPMQYIAPYAGCTLAEYFMRKGRDVLIVYDDLSKHAVAYRALSLLLGRSPGREAYPGDVFYLHSRLLERAAHLSVELGGGSITALPIVETQAGDISAYIPTNIISITDGQIFLESELFFSGQRPAVNVGISVSRVGGAAQTAAMKSASGAIRLELAQYREMEVFMQFASELDESTRQLLIYGQGLMQLLRQKQYRSLNLHEQIITLVAATSHVMFEIPTAKVKRFQEEMLAYFESECSDICNELETSKALSNELRARILEAALKFQELAARQYAPER